MPADRDNLPIGAHRGSDRELRTGIEIGPELLDLGGRRLAGMDAAGIDMQVLSLNQPGCQALEGAAAIALARDSNDLLSDAIKIKFLSDRQLGTLEFAKLRWKIKIVHLRNRNRPRKETRSKLCELRFSCGTTTVNRDQQRIGARRALPAASDCLDDNVAVVNHQSPMLPSLWKTR